MSFFKWLLAGVAGAAVGGIAWVGIGYFTNYEIGWIAWGIGLLAGLGVRAAAGGENTGAAPGIAAVAAAAAVVAVSKYAVIALFMQFDMAAQIANERPDFDSDEYAIVRTADEIIEAEYFASGKEVAWPAGVTYEDADTEAEYPPAIWAPARDKWTALSDDEKRSRREAWKNQYEADIAEWLEVGQSEAFAESFTPYDLLWFGLAMFTAFKVGSGSGREE